ncbi:hypothetical protein [Streptomyces neyagawaensis]|uniref:hypothetical protein n=1 Tax=Streptomyces neyagawaensis TaxID=42238 RepID=UPI0012FEAEB2|nr:hypothetical protein [Streptomyces neyagawaensis]MCL6731525.1 hypothetical protein [Streptomyces neyagawaensis]MDE1683081.1 hypothetical protein [Streptomyces neyagawaensis]
MTTTRRRRLRQNRVLALGRGRDAPHGTWLGHPVYPPAMRVPVGSWLSVVPLDPRPGRSDPRIIDGRVEIRPRRDDRAEHARTDRETEREPGAAKEGVPHGSPGPHV